MALPASDSFTYANGNLSTRTGNYWSVQTSESDNYVSSNKAVGNTTGTNVNYWNQDSFNNNQWSQGTISCGTNANAKAGVTVRASTSARTYYYWVQIYNSNVQRVYKCVTGTRTQIGSDYTNTYAAGKVFKLSVSGTTLTPYWDAVAQSTQSDSAISSGNAGIFTQYYSGTEIVDDWSGGNVSAGVTTGIETIDGVAIGIIGTIDGVDIGVVGGKDGVNK